jgi:hypothetical protein
MPGTSELYGMPLPVNDSMKMPMASRAAPAAGHDQHAEHQRVAVDHPLGQGQAGVQVLFDLRDGHAQRGEVVGDDEDAEPMAASASQVPRLSRSGALVAAMLSVCPQVAQAADVTIRARLITAGNAPGLSAGQLARSGPGPIHSASCSNRPGCSMG